MRILVVGATGTIGRAVVNALADHHEIIPASRKSGVHVDLSDPGSIRAMYEKTGNIDAVVSTAGSGKFGQLDQLSDEDFAFGLGNKLMGQINLVRFGREFVSDGGSFTLTSGILSHQPNPASVLLTTLNAAVEGFGRAAALDMPRGQTVNTVSPPLVRETAERMGWGPNGVPADEVAQMYVDSLFGGHGGDVIDYSTSLDRTAHRSAISA